MLHPIGYRAYTGLANAYKELCGMPLTSIPSYVWHQPDHPASVPLVFASPHSGRHYPESLCRMSHLRLMDLRRCEDSYVDELVTSVTQLGTPLLAATYGRAYVDLNRDATELDPLLLTPEPEIIPAMRTERVCAGLGVIPRIVSANMPIYRAPLPLAEAEKRLTRAYYPYHRTLKKALKARRAANGWAGLVDCHSMPSTMHHQGTTPADIVLGDRYGKSCAPIFMDILEQAFRAHGLKVVRNAPYAGGYCTSRYGRPHEGVHALQVEICRALYMDEARLIRHQGFKHMAAVLQDVFTQLIAAFDMSQPIAAE